jgi:GNAT superfamily N-acetyltransferase
MELEFKKWMKLDRRRFQFHYAQDSIHIYTKSGNVVGSLWFRPSAKGWDESGDARTFHLDHIAINSQYQGQGLGTLLLTEFRHMLLTRYPNIKFLTGDATSQGIISLMTKIFGTPVSTKGDELPARSPADWLSTNIRAKVKFNIQ